MLQNKYTIPSKGISKIKHYPTSVKEWPNSIYLYNKKELINAPLKNKLASKLIKSYFNLSNETRIARSKRMRDLLKRLSSKRLFVSKIEMKHNNDKYCLNIYVHNRTKQFLLRKIYMFNKNMLLYKKWKTNKFYIKNAGTFPSRHRLFGVKFLNSFLRKGRSYFDIYMNNEINSYLFKSNKSLGKITNLFFYKLILKKKIDKMLSSNVFNIVTLIKNNMSISKDKNKLLYLIQKCYQIYYNNFINKINRNKVNRKNILAKTMYIKFLINQFKFNKFLPKLKILLENIFNKKVELNIVDLKYLHLNSDTLIDSLTVKTRKRRSVKSIISRSMGLIKIPDSFVKAEPISFLPELYRYKTFDGNHLHNMYKGYYFFPYNNITKNINRKDILNKFLLNMYSIPTFYQGKYLQFSRNIKYASVINSIKYKWLSGIRLEAAGRLTRRFTASRSMHFLKHKGNIKHVEYNRELNAKHNLSVVLLRNIARSNRQYTFGHSKKRIGAFGIKGWITSK